jgi:hypothetical protein
MTNRTFLYKKLRANEDGTVDVVGYAEAEEWSVLAGQTIRHYIATYPDMYAAQEAHPEATTWFHPLTEPQVSFNHLSDEGDY